MRKLQKQFEDLKRTNGSAVLPLSNWGGIEIVANDDFTGVLYKWYGKVCRRWQKIKYSVSGREYLTINHIRYYLDDFMRLC